MNCLLLDRLGAHDSKLGFQILGTGIEWSHLRTFLP